LRSIGLEGDGSKKAFNSRYLQDLLAALNSEIASR